MSTSFDVARPVALDRIRSILLWLEYLQGVGLGVLEPILTSEKRPILHIAKQVGQRHRYGVLRRWIEGLPIQLVSDEEKTPEFISRVGEFLARMHAHSAEFKAPDWFTAECKNRETISHSIEASNREEVREAGRQLLRFLDTIGETRENFGLIHHDATGLNLLYGSGVFSAVDWGGLCYGHYITDIVQMCRDGIATENYTYFFSGYQRVRPLPDHFVENLETLKTARRVGLL